MKSRATARTSASSPTLRRTNSLTLASDVGGHDDEQAARQQREDLHLILLLVSCADRKVAAVAADPDEITNGIENAYRNGSQ